MPALNPLTFDGASFTWMGRELVKYTKDGKEITFRYDENGLRHRKTITENGTQRDGSSVSNESNN